MSFAFEDMHPTEPGNGDECEHCCSPTLPHKTLCEECEEAEEARLELLASEDIRPGLRAFGAADLYRCECGNIDIDGGARGSDWYCRECLREGRPRVQPMGAAE